MDFGTLLSKTLTQSLFFNSSSSSLSSSSLSPFFWPISDSGSLVDEEEGANFFDPLFLAHQDGGDFFFWLVVGRREEKRVM